MLSQWSDDGSCSVSCGGGQISQTRTIVVAPDGGGAPCGTQTQTVTCNTELCPVNCGFYWNGWSGCPGNCGPQMNVQTVTIYQPAQGNGQQCPNNRIWIQTCQQSMCNDCDNGWLGPNGFGCYGGSCVDTSPFDETFTCACSPGWTGENCEVSAQGNCAIAADGPHGATCKNNGVCTQDSSDPYYTCSCWGIPYAGKCTINIPDITPSFQLTVL